MSVATTTVTKTTVIVPTQPVTTVLTAQQGPPGPPGSSGSVGNLIWNEPPTGTINGVNATFTLSSAPVGTNIMLFLNGIKLRAGASNDFTLSGQTITMLQIPLTGDTLEATYQY